MWKYKNIYLYFYLYKCIYIDLFMINNTLHINTHVYKQYTEKHANTFNKFVAI